MKASTGWFLVAIVVLQLGAFAHGHSIALWLGLCVVSGVLFAQHDRALLDEHGVKP